MKDLSEEQLIALATSLALKIARSSDNDDEILILADFFNLIGATLIAIYDRRSIDTTMPQDNSKK